MKSGHRTKLGIDFPKRISYKLARTSVILAFAIGLLLSFVQLIWDYRIERHALDHTIQRILEVSQPPAARSVHILDDDLALEVVTGLLQYDFVVEARIFDDLNIELAGLQKEELPSRTRWITKHITTEYLEYSISLSNTDFQSDQPGLLHVIVDSDAALADFIDRTTFLFLMGFVRNMLLVIALLVAFYWMLTRPLVELVEDIGSLEPKDMDGGIGSKCQKIMRKMNWA